MKTITRLLATAALLFGVVGGVTSVKAAKTIGTEYTSVADLNGKSFAIVNKTYSKALFHRGYPSPFTTGYDIYRTAFYNSNLHYLYKIEASNEEGKYYIRCVNEDGTNFDNNYLESDANETFIFSKDIAGANTALWEIAYVPDNGWTMKNVAKNGYSDGTNNAATNGAPTYLTFCQVVNTDPTITISNAESVAQTLESNPENFTEITQENVQTGYTAADKVVEEGYTTYTTKEGEAGQVNIAIKTKDVDVAGCDFVLIKFAEEIAAEGWKVAFWGNNSLEDINKGDTEYKLVFSEDPLGTHPTAFKSEGVLKEITLMTLWTYGPITAKVKGIYKHIAVDFSRTYSFNEALDFTDTGLEAYVITGFDADKGTLKLSRVNQVPANTGLYLVGKGGDYNIPTLESADPIATNLLKPSGDGTITKISGDYTNLVLAGSGDNRGFHPLSEDGNMGENKAYLQLSTTDYNSIAGARLKMVFEDEATAIKTVKVAEVETGIYNLAGQRLAKAQKGLNIINGKKVLVK